MNTDECKAELVQKYGGNVDNWKRTKRLGGINKRDTIYRLFQNKDLEHGPYNATVIDDPYDGVMIVEGNLYPGQNKATVAELKKVGARIKHCGDYGNVYYSELEHSVWWEGGDGDGCAEEGMTDFDDIEAWFMAVPGIKEVHIEAEAGPELDRGYILVYKPH